MDLELNQRIDIWLDGQRREYFVSEHPAAPGLPFVSEARKARVYQLVSGSDKATFALKVMKRKYRLPELEKICRDLARFEDVPGFQVCFRQCLTRQRSGHTLTEFPDLEFSILMPWISGTTWYDVIAQKIPLRAEQSLAIASSLANSLSALEARGAAHTDLSAANLMVYLDDKHIELIDIEDLYAPGFSAPRDQPCGTPGYQHKTSSRGQWGSHGDRFSAAILFAEILSWHNADVRSAAQPESFFDPSELQQTSCKAFTRIRSVLRSASTDFADLLDKAWSSARLDACPPIAEWRDAIARLHPTPPKPAMEEPRPPGTILWQELDRPPPRSPYEPGWDNSSPLGPAQPKKYSVRFEEDPGKKQ